MNKLAFAMVPWLFAAFSYKAMAQEGGGEKNQKAETQEIIIRKKGDKDVKITVQVTGDKVMINGKPLIEFKDDEISVNNRKIIIRDHDITGFGNMEKDFNLQFGNSLTINGFGKKRTFLGVTTVTDENGTKINAVSKESPAEKAGLLKDDIIKKVNGTVISSQQQLTEVISSLKAKDEVTVVVKRGKKDKKIKVTLGEVSSSGALSGVHNLHIDGIRDGGSDIKVFGYPRVPGAPRPPVPGESWNYNNDIQSLTFDGNAISINNMSRKKLGLKIQDTEEATGVKVLEVEDSSAAAIAGLMKDDIITTIGSEKVTNTDEAREQLQANREKSSYPVKATRNGSEMTFTIRIPKNLKTANL